MIVARLVVPLAIPRYPLPGILASLLIDTIDQTVFEAILGQEFAGYQLYDKALDVYYQTIAYISTLRNWARGPVFFVARCLWYYRLIGVVLFEIFDARSLLLVFPNTFEYYFIAIEFMKVARNPFGLRTRQAAALAAFIWVWIKLPQEWWLHVAQLDFTDLVKQYVFGVPRDAPWLSALRSRPLALLWFLVAGLAIVRVTRAAARRLSFAEWPATLAADTQNAHMGWPTPPSRTRPTPFFGWAFAEKVLLVSLVVTIFVQILPGAGPRLPEVWLGAASIVTATAFISQTLARRGVTWRSSVMQFTAMYAGNTALAISVQLIRPGILANSLPVVLFLIGIVTLIVSTYDRYRLIARARSAP